MRLHTYILLHTPAYYILLHTTTYNHTLVSYYILLHTIYHYILLHTTVYYMLLHTTYYYILVQYKYIQAACKAAINLLGEQDSHNAIRIDLDDLGGQAIYLWMRHVTHMNESCHTCACFMSLMNESCYVWMMYVIYVRKFTPRHLNWPRRSWWTGYACILESCQTYEWVMEHLCMRHVTHKWVVSYINHVCHTLEGVRTAPSGSSIFLVRAYVYVNRPWHIWMSHVAY